jgi:CRISPR-associated protein Cas8a1/Csx13
MARELKVDSGNGSTPCACLTMSLLTPGMSPLHRAGLGGLACTLKFIEREVRAGRLKDKKVPGGPWPQGKPPWEISATAVTLHFGDPGDAGEFLRRLFAIAFSLDQGLISTPGVYGELSPALPVRALLQQGMTLTFLQHGRVRSLAKTETICDYQPEGEGAKTLQVEYKKCAFYKHQDGWKELVNSRGVLETKPIEVVGPMNPGAMVRHVAFTADTKIQEDVAHVLPLYFSLVGCLALPINRGSGVLIVPEVEDLLRFCEMRPSMTPQTVRECQITNASDAAIQAQLRVRLKRVVSDHDLPACHGVEFRPTPWASQQKSRVRTITVLPGAEAPLDLFAAAMLDLPPRIIARRAVETRGKGKHREAIEKTEWFWADSIVRPLVANNLASCRPWYQGFVELMTKIDPANKRPLRDKLSFEKKGLYAMIETSAWQDRGEATVVRAVHEAMRRRFGQIASENQKNVAARKKRWQGEYDRWRLAFAGAKTADQFRRSLCDLLSRAGINPVLQQDWQQILPLLASERWQLARDLALLGLASYTGTDGEDADKSTALDNDD